MDDRTVLRIVKSSACLVLILLSLFIFSSSMGKKAVNAEHASCAAGVLLTKGKMIYRDFACVAQMPYHPFLCAALYKVLNTTYYLFSARLLTVVCDILIVISIIGIFRHIFSEFPVAGWLLGMAMAIMCVFNVHFSKVSGFAMNHDFMILCVLVSFWLFISADFKQSSHYLRIWIMSALLTLASCMDFTAVFIGQRKAKNCLCFFVCSRYRFDSACMDNASVATRFFHKRCRDAFAEDAIDTQDELDDGDNVFRQICANTYLRYGTSRNFSFSGGYLSCCADCMVSTQFRDIEFDECVACRFSAGDIFCNYLMHSLRFV